MARRTALVTGGMGGLGEAIVARLHAAGHRIVVTASPDNHRSVAWLEEKRETGIDVVAYPLDVANFQECAETLKKIRVEAGPIDILVNNAGITRDATLRKMAQSDWQKVLRTNLDSAFNVTQPLLGDMIERRWGRIINVASVNGQRGQFGQTNYAAAKAGLHGFTMSLALEAARHGVTVNTVSPGYLHTRMLEAVPPEILEKNILPMIPVGRLGRPEEIAALVAFVASDDAAYITGANLAINGGLHMQ
ncbi:MULTISPECIES: acetoacetyl-CoA reductase [unclassified Achromobacter]|uniref:acetoacetyl-CoA reductase n=1 Tax=unclassified Achromobacter TaxID=2626865 RepID=UPI000B5154D2|nr:MULTISPECIES: acetoacetyl-CoA reductase [unclassified Achromobacter]OWT74695.1 beta-ketoacyl-ACP reductase [Achromobacter sp. HZ34]OWT79162.1 beta-ketoacyl-ACP reductase [Achromobacter sp. HZ28]